MSTLEFDELNEFQRYFLPMRISDEQKKRREQLANAIYDAMLFFFSAIRVYLKNGEYTREYFKKMLYNKLIDAVVEHTGTDDVLQTYLSEIANDVADVTLGKFFFHFINPPVTGGIATQTEEDDEDTEDDMLKDNYWLSESRAFNIAVNETNTILNYSEYLEAIENGKTRKRWLTMKDERVRFTHFELDGAEIDIEDVFYVGESIMRYPRDFEYGASLNEILGCRCSVEYF